MTQQALRELVELAAALEKQIDAGDGAYPQDYHDTFGKLEAALPALERLLAGEQGWIACSERMPDCDMQDRSFGVEVLVHPHTERTAFYGCRQTKEPNFYKYGAVLSGITHWMPLPPAPTGG